MGKILKGVGKLVGKITGSYDANKAAAAQADQMRQQNEMEAKRADQQAEQMRQQTMAQQSMAESTMQRDKAMKEAQAKIDLQQAESGGTAVDVDAGGSGGLTATASRKRYQSRGQQSSGLVL